MKKSLLSTVALAVSVFALPFLSPSDGFAQKQPSRGSNGTANETYMVVKIVDENKDETKGEKRVEYKAVSASQLKGEEKRVKEENARKLKEWHDLRITDPTAPQPKKIVIKKIPKLTGYETQTIASEVARKLTDEEADKAAGAVKPKDNKQ